MELVLGIVGFVVLFPPLMLGMIWWCEVCYKYFFSNRG